MPPTADSEGTSSHFRFVPKAKLACSFDHLVGQRQHRRWNFEIDRFRSLEVEHEQIARRLFEREIGGLRSLENPIDQGGGAFEGFLEIGSIGHQTPPANKKN